MKQEYGNTQRDNTCKNGQKAGGIIALAGILIAGVSKVVEIIGKSNNNPGNKT